MTEETIALKARQVKNSQIIQCLDQLIENIRPDIYLEHNSYFQVTQWLYLKLSEYNQNLYTVHGLYIWECEAGSEQPILKRITSCILEDMTVLGEK